MIQAVENALGQSFGEPQESFSSGLNHSLAARSIPNDVLHYIHSNETKLAVLDLPPDLEANTTALVRKSVSNAFLFGFRTIMLICAGLSLASALVAWLMIPART